MERLSGPEFSMPAHHAGWIRFNRAGERIYSGGGPEVCVWCAHTFQLLERIPTGYPSVGRPGLNPDGRRLAIGCPDGSAGIWNLASGKRDTSLALHAGAVTEVRWLPDGRLASAGADGFVRWVDPAEPASAGGARRLSRRKHDPVRSLAAGGDRLAALHAPGAEVWSLDGRDLLRVRAAYDHGEVSPSDIELSADGGTAWIAFRGTRQVAAWRLPAATPAPDWVCEVGAPAYALALSPDEEWIAVGLWGEAALLSVPERRVVTRWTVESGDPHYAAAVWDLCFSPDGRNLAAAVTDTGRLFAWRMPGCT